MKKEETIQHDIHEEYKKQLIGFEYQERAVLGLLLTDRDAACTALVEYDINKEHFFYAHTRAIFRAIESVFNAGFLYSEQRILQEFVRSREIRETDGMLEITDIKRIAKAASKCGLTIRQLCEILENNREFRSCYFLLTRYEPPTDPNGNAVFYH